MKVIIAQISNEVVIRMDVVLYKQYKNRAQI